MPATNVRFGQTAWMKKKENDMGIFKAQTKRDDVKLLGAFLPIRLHKYLTFYSLAKGKTKTDVVKDLLYAWMTERREIENDKDLIRDIIARLDIQWKIEKASGKGMTMSEFKDAVRNELFIKGLAEEHIDVIIAEMRK